LPPRDQTFQPIAKPDLSDEAQFARGLGRIGQPTRNGIHLACRMKLRLDMRQTDDLAERAAELP
jgi:hypothetical protein